MKEILHASAAHPQEHVTGCALLLHLDGETAKSTDADSPSRVPRPFREPRNMASIEQSVHDRGGLAATHELHSDGHSRSAIAGALSRGRLLRVRQGWYCLPSAHPHLREAARVGGLATCLTGLALHGAWTVATPILHIAVPANSCRLRTRTDKRERLTDAPNPLVRVHWNESGIDERLIRSPLDCLADLVRCEPPEMVTATADSALHRNPLLIEGWLELIASSPIHHRPWLSRIDGVCESGTESIFWFRMSPWGLPVERQVTIDGVGRVDFLVGSRLVIEIDSARYHTSPEDYERDRRRDALLSALGYRVLRFTYEQILHRWHEVEAAVIASVLRGDHR